MHSTVSASLPLPLRMRPGRSIRLRVLALGAVVIAGVLGLLYLAARETSLFALRTIEVAGAPPEIEAAIRDALETQAGESLVALDADAVEDRLRALPAVRTAAVERDFPHTLRVAVGVEQPVLVARVGSRAWLVSETGRALGEIDAREAPKLPRIWLPAEAGTPKTGRMLPDAAVAAAGALARVPQSFPASVVSARGSRDDLVLVLASKTEIHLGPAGGVKLKLAAAAAVLKALGRDERRALAYLDVSVPTRVVAAAKSQVGDSA